MQNSQDTVLFTTLSGMAGGITKAVSETTIQCGFDLNGIVEVSGYAILSAFVGYVVKFGMDRIVDKVKNHFKTGKHQ